MDGLDIALICLGVVIFLLMVILFVLALIVIRSRRRNRIAKAESVNSAKKASDVEVNNNKTVDEYERKDTANGDDPKRINRPTEIKLPNIRTVRTEYKDLENTEIPKKDFTRLLQECVDNDFDRLEKEFEVLNHGMYSERKSVIQSINTMKKNRFMDVLPYDDNRVKIANHSHDYINASFIDGYNVSRKYIATQGPIGDNEASQGKRDSTMEDFWVMLWEQRVHCIVMLTECIENLLLKCAQYWPENEEEICEYGRIEVRLVTSTVDEICTQREMEVKYGSEVRTVTQWHYKGWLDSRGPQDAGHLLDFIGKVAASLPLPPILVHCSAGVGRTGVFIALDILLEHIKEHPTVDIFACVRRLREQRVRMVQTVEQYITLYEAVSLAIQYLESEEMSVRPRVYTDRPLLNNCTAITMNA